MIWRFTLSHAVLGSQVISEPDGWKGAKMKLERHPEFFSLIEYYLGAANDAFIFYGDNGVENGGIDFIRQVEITYGFDAVINILIESSEDEITFTTVFSGQLGLAQKNEMKDNKMQLPVIRGGLWAKFINRFETPVDLSSTTDMDGNAVAPVLPITVHLTSQALRENYDATSSGPGVTEEDVTVIIDGTYYQMSFDNVVLDEIEKVYILPQTDQAELPSAGIELKYGGTYSFDIKTVFYDYSPGLGGYNFGPGEDLSDFVRVYININGVETEFALGDFFDSVNTDGGRFYTLSLTNQALPAGSLVRIYGRAIADLTATPSYPGQIRWNGPIIGNISLNSQPLADESIESYCRITADTVYPATEAPGFLLHDVIHGTLARLGLGTDPFYSEFLGGLLTTSKQYDDDGCGWMYAVLKGIHIRGYTLTGEDDDPTLRYGLKQKSFFTSMKELWDGANPILNLGLGYEVIDDVEVIRIEQKVHFIGDTAPVNFSNVREISSSYDQEYIFKTIKTGYKEWQAEQNSGLDDPQTKHSYATRFITVGKELNLESEFIAAGGAIEKTRRTSIIKSADYKFDNKIFIIALNTNDLSPDVYVPELDENFDSISNLLNSDTRYNLILTPLRNLLRWANYIGGCLQSYITSDAYRFVSGEGNYDMVSDYSCGSGNACQAIICDPLSEKQNISLIPYNAPIGFFFLPIEYDMVIPMEKDEYDAIDRKQPIGISQTDEDHALFHIKELEYEIVKGEAKIKAWPVEFFNIGVQEQEITMPCP